MYVFCVCLSIVVFNTYCVVFLFCFVVLFLRLVYPMLPASLNFPYLIATSVFSNVYFLWYDSLGLSNNNVDIVFSAHGRFWNSFNQVHSREKNARSVT